MGRICFLFLSFISSASLFAQIPTDDMESWRTTMSGTTAAIAVEAPFSWYGSDSTVIGIGRTPFVALALGTHDSDWRRQIFKESSIVHGGSFSAKIMTRKEYTYRIPGVLTNAIPSVGITISPPGISGISLKGGTPIAAKPASVSVWVQYYAGKDSLGNPGIDSGSLTVQALGQVGGKDSVIGTGYVIIPPASAWLQVTANLTYPVFTDVAVDTFRISLSSGKGPSGMDSSTLYADDLTMASDPNPDHSGVHTVRVNNVVVHPNPTTGIIYIDGNQNTELNLKLFSADGKNALYNAKVTGNKLDLSCLPDGIYFYTLTDNTGKILNSGKQVISK